MCGLGVWVGGCGYGGWKLEKRGGGGDEGEREGDSSRLNDPLQRTEGEERRERERERESFTTDFL